MASQPPTDFEPVTREEIARLPTEFAVALAARCAMRVAPILGRSGSFNYWESSAQKHCMAVETAALEAALTSIGHEKTAYAGQAASEAAAAIAARSSFGYNDIYAAAAAASHAAVAPAYGGTLPSIYVYSADAKAAAGDAMDNGGRATFELAVRQDQEWLISFLGNPSKATRVAAPTAFFERPLWEQMPDKWDKILEAWRRALAGVKLEDIYHRHVQMLKGGGLNWEAAEAWVKQWAKERNDSREEARQKKTAPAPPPEPKFFNDGTTPSALGDQPSKQDHLGREKLARVLASMFASKAQGTPFTVAILGEWGSGKSTLMELMKSDLAEPGRAGRFDIAEFNAWEYEHTDNIRAGLAQEVVNGLTKDLTGWSRWKFIWAYAQAEHAKDLRRILLGLIGLIFAIAISSGVAFWWLKNPYVQALMGTGVAVGAVTFFVTTWKNLKAIIDHPLSTELTTYLKLPSYGEHLGQVPVIKKQLKSLCNLRLKTVGTKPDESRRLIVFVDDLDRCSPKCITDTLDAIRLVMNIPGVIVVIMIDHRIAIKAVAEQYAGLADKQHDCYAIARDYLGKIIQVPIMLLPVKPDKMGKFIKQALFPSAKNTFRLVPLPPDAKRASPPAPVAAGQSPAATGTAAPATPPPTRANVAAVSPPLAARLSAEVIKQQEHIEEEMQDTVDDREFFQKLVEVFGFTNPRQLLRMRNSFRVLKGIERSNSDQSVTPETAQKMLLALFWLEHLYNQNSAERAKLTADAFSQNESSSYSTEVKTFRSQCHELFGADALKLDKQKVLKDFLGYVSRFVLPYHD